MQTKRILTEDDARSFFHASTNTMEDAIGEAIVDMANQTIRFNFNAVLLLSFANVFADRDYPLDSNLLDRKLIQQMVTNQTDTTETSSFDYVHDSPSPNKHFTVKQITLSETNFRYTLICVEKLMDTESQLGLFSRVVGSGLSLFTGCTWWIDYDKFSDHFYSSDSGPTILGIPVAKDRIYNTQEFQVVREKARIVSELYDESVTFEVEAYERVRRNETDYFAGRTPTVTNKDEIVWVEAYGKCILRYPDGRPRFFVAIDIYMSEIHEEKTQLELLTNLIDYGLINSDVGVWYHQRHYLEGKYYFTKSFQELMSDTRTYKDESFTDILNEQIKFMEEDGRGYEQYLHEFRKTHNSIYLNNVDKYHIVIPNFKNKDTLIWIEVRGTVIERDEEGHVMLFVGVNVDVTESTLRNRELERLRLQNERLQLAETLAIKARNLMIWYQDVSGTSGDQYLFGNDVFIKKLGIHRTAEGMISYSDIRRTLDRSDEEGIHLAHHLTEAFKDIYRGKRTSFNGVLAKHKNLQTGQVLYVEHSVELSDIQEDGKPSLIGGVLLDVTDNILREQRIRYLADYDTLTDTYNRNYFELYTSTRLPKSYTVMLFDLDGLKLINDVYGHMTGDTIIQQLGVFLKQVYYDSLFVARIGGDEFCVLSPSYDTKHITDQANDLEERITTFNRESDIEMNVSKGGKVVINNDITFEKAFVQAENIMYRRKLNNRTSRKAKVLESILETLNAKTEETKEHSDRMAELAILTMEELRMTRASEVEDMLLLARVHDIGKITIDDNILKKPSRLTKDEFELIKKHCEAGYKIIRNITDSDDVCNGVLLHHERWDGSGYPQGLQGNDIPIFARIISVVDAFDAMTNDRIYHKKIEPSLALAEIERCSGTQFDPKIVQAFLQAYSKHNK